MRDMLQAMSGADLESPSECAPTIDELVIADALERWRALGFTVVGECSQLGRARVRLAGRGAGRGIVRWSLRAIAGVELDGLPTTRSESPVPALAPAHPSGALAIITSSRCPRRSSAACARSRWPAPRVSAPRCLR
jgi:hypothetical protein